MVTGVSGRSTIAAAALFSQLRRVNNGPELLAASVDGIDSEVSMKVIVHIGTEKTGTSTIQEFLLQNKARLLESGFFYLHMPGRNEYRDFSAYCMRADKVDYYFRLINVKTPAAREQFNRRFLEDFQRAILSIPDGVHTVVISSEHLSSCLHSVAEITGVKTVLAPYFDQIKIVCYLREQGETIVSQYSTRVKSGHCESFSEYFAVVMKVGKGGGSGGYGSGIRYKYDVLLGLWCEVFSRAALRVRLFNKNSFVGGSLTSDFVSLLADDLYSSLQPLRQQQNESLSALGCQVLRIINYLFPDFIRGGRTEKVRSFIIAVVSKLTAGKPVSMSESQRQLVWASFADANERIRQEYFSDRVALFERRES